MVQNPKKRMEILSPVNADTLEAALDAGADAVYFGLKKLNARRGAKNFGQAELAEVVRKIHDRGAKAHLTVNIDLCTRETGLAARTLAFAQECGVDAVIVRDPAILALRPFFPRLEFHLSTQSGVSSSAGARMAKELHCDRVVLARELTHDEIASCCNVGGIDIETFGQGAMCFCASGRCLLSSWVGGRSGNRGACASPCRVGWKLVDGDAKEAHPMSMKDLCLVDELPELSRLGVVSLKIEGRLKSAQWVNQAVSLYRKAKNASAGLTELREEASSLGAYTGRALAKA
ncbi:MAG: U32 family peptidase [Lentisphaeria bacterium]|nr:U32 family peptidase [Lentisphaeria bacterium]